MAPPPPPNDTVSWPTPSLAQEEEKKKDQDHVERSDKEKITGRVHGKDKWEKVPVSFSTKFNTPMPIRARGNRLGGRGGRDTGSRGGHATNGSISIPESGGNLDGQSSTTQPFERNKPGDMGPPRNLPTGRVRRSASAGPSSAKEHRRGTDGAQDKREDPGHRNSVPNRSHDTRRVSVSTQTENGTTPNGQSANSEAQRRSSVYSEQPSGDGIPSRAPFDKRSDWRSRETNQEYNSNYAPHRERGDGRPDRGRAGWRGKGTHMHSNFAQNTQNQNGHTFGAGKAHSYGEQRHNSQPQSNTFQNGREPRHNRTGSRSQSIPQPSSYNRFNSGVPPAPPNGMPNLHIDVSSSMYPYQAPTVMSAMHYNPGLEYAQLLGIVQLQM
jgi:la-related protein 1